MLISLFHFFFFVRARHITTTEPVVNRFAGGRRKSVFAEQYDPEEDNDDEDNNKVIFPKTDEQRSRLCDSVKNILLFRSLDPEQVCIQLFKLAHVYVTYSHSLTQYTFNCIR
jgi:hypothetical protein